MKYVRKDEKGKPFRTRIIYAWNKKSLVDRYFDTQEEMNTWLDKECLKGKVYHIEGYYEKISKKYVAYYKPPCD